MFIKSEGVVSSKLVRPTHFHLKEFYTSLCICNCSHPGETSLTFLTITSGNHCMPNRCIRAVRCIIVNCRMRVTCTQSRKSVHNTKSVRVPFLEHKNPTVRTKSKFMAALHCVSILVIIPCTKAMHFTYTPLVVVSDHWNHYY